MFNFDNFPVVYAQGTFAEKPQMKIDGDMETPQQGNASKKKNHKINLMSSSLIKKKYVNNYFTINLG